MTAETSQEEACRYQGYQVESAPGSFLLRFLRDFRRFLVSG